LPFFWISGRQKAFSFRGLRLSPPDQDLCPWTPLGAPPRPRYTLVLRARHGQGPSTSLSKFTPMCAAHVEDESSCHISVFRPFRLYFVCIYSANSQLDPSTGGPVPTGRRFRTQTQIVAAARTPNMKLCESCSARVPTGDHSESSCSICCQPFLRTCRVTLRGPATIRIVTKEDERMKGFFSQRIPHGASKCRDTMQCVWKIQRESGDGDAVPYRVMPDLV